MDIDKILEFLTDLDQPTKVAMVVFLVLAWLAQQLMGNDARTWVKLVVFVLVAAFGAGAGAVGLHLVAARNANTEAAPPGAREVAPTISGIRWPTVVAYANDGSGWVYCGKFDEKTTQSREWVQALEPMEPSSRSRLPADGSRLRTRSATDLYADQPRFTAMGLKWTLASVLFRIPADKELTVKRCRVFGDNGWCEVAMLP